MPDAAVGNALSPNGRTFIVVSPLRDVSDVEVAVNWTDEARRTWTTAVSKMTAAMSIMAAEQSLSCSRSRILP